MSLATIGAASAQTNATQATATIAGNGAVASRALPILRVAPSVLASSGVVTLSVPANAFSTQSANVRLHVRLFEANRPVRVADADRDFKRNGDTYQASFALDADPGSYEFRVMSDNRPRVAVSQAAPLSVSGVRREAGWWLLNGTPFVAGIPFLSGPFGDATDGKATGNAAPLFVSGLKRDFNPKAKKTSVSIRVSPNFKGQTIQLPQLRALLASDSTAMRTIVARLLAGAKASGAREMLGFSLPVGDSTGTLPTIEARSALVRLRAVLNDLAPEAALILDAHIFFHPADAARDIDSCAALCDAVVLTTFTWSERNTWPIKVARRVAEEQPNYDLPIFLRIAPQMGSILYDNGLSDDEISTVSLESWMNGVSGIAFRSERASWEQIVERNAPLFIGSATYEDIGLLPAPDFNRAPDRRSFQKHDETELYQAFRDARRIPFLARLKRQGKRAAPESFAIRLGQNISATTIEQLRQAADGGARIYIEGTPFQDENGRPAPWRMSTLVGAAAVPLAQNLSTIASNASPGENSTNAPSTSAASTSAASTSATMILQDGWMFGTGRGTRVEVERNAVVALLAPDAARAPKAERGLDKLLGPRVAARLEDGSPALIVNPVGRGEVIWLPHRIVEEGQDFLSFAAGNRTNFDEPIAIFSKMQAGGKQLSRVPFSLVQLPKAQDDGATTVAPARHMSTHAAARGQDNAAIDAFSPAAPSPIAISPVATSPMVRVAAQSDDATGNDATPAGSTPAKSSATSRTAADVAASLSTTDADLDIDRSTARQRFYAAIASYVQPPLVSLRGTNAKLAGIENVRVALRRSAKGTLLLAVFNPGARPATIAASVDGVAGVALDLASERELALKVRGFQSEVNVTIPARGYRLIALSDSRRALDEERNAPRLQARLR